MDVRFDQFTKSNNQKPIVKAQPEKGSLTFGNDSFMTTKAHTAKPQGKEAYGVDNCKIIGR